MSSSRAKGLHTLRLRSSLNVGDQVSHPYIYLYYTSKETWCTRNNSLLKYRVWHKDLPHFEGQCAGYCRVREVGVVSCGWLASTVFSTHNEVDRWTSGPCCWSVLWEQPFCDTDSESVLHTLRARSKCPCDFFLWGYLKEEVFIHRPRSLEDVKERIQQEMDSIPPELTRRMMKNFRGTSSAMCCQRRPPYDR